MLNIDIYLLQKVSLEKKNFIVLKYIIKNYNLEVTKSLLLN